MNRAKNIIRNIFLAAGCALFLLSSSATSPKQDEMAVRLEVIYPGGAKVAEPSEMLPVKICFDFVREAKNYSVPFNYEISLVCNEKNVSKETGKFEPPEGIAIKRTTICKTIKFIPKDFIKPQTSVIALKARIDINEEGSKTIKGESKAVEAHVKSAYGQITVTGTIICPSELPLSLAKVDIYSKMADSKLVIPHSNVTVFTEPNGSFTALLPAPTDPNMHIIAQLSCPGDEYPSMTISGNVSGNACSFGTINMQCNNCGGAISPGEKDLLER